MMYRGSMHDEVHQALADVLIADGAVTIPVPSSVAVCVECDRKFDLLNEDDAGLRQIAEMMERASKSEFPEDIRDLHYDAFTLRRMADVLDGEDKRKGGDRRG